MKKIAFYILTSIMILSLAGCGSQEEKMTSSDIINRSIIQVSDASSFEYTLTVDESTAIGDKILTTQSVAEVKQILQPYTLYSQSDKTTLNVDGQTFRIITEMYQSEHDGILDLYLRFGNPQDTSTEPTLSDWQKHSSNDKASIDMLVDINRKNFEAGIYLLSSNINSFNLTDDKETYVFEGTITPDTILEGYQRYLRENYIKSGMVVGSSNPTMTDLKNELTNGQRPELQTGFTKLAYSNQPIPVTIWINKSTYAIEKVVIDEKTALQEIVSIEIPKLNLNLGEPSVNKAIYTFDAIGINTVKEISQPE